MQGAGNDYLYHYGEIPNVEKASVKFADRHFGIGSDGIILILPSERADFMMRIFNADGSEAKMCGNGIRCVGKYVYDNGYTHKTEVDIDTLSGVKNLKLNVVDGKVKSARVDMGHVTVSRRETVTLTKSDEDFVTNEKSDQDLRTDITFTPVSTGNPHAVVFVEDMEKTPVDIWGPLMEHNERFPGGVNTEFIQVIDDHTLRMRVWERGSGITLACGTGACASVSAAVSEGYVKDNTDVKVILDGGELVIRHNDNGTVTMTGPAETVAVCEVDWEDEVQ